MPRTCSQLRPGHSRVQAERHPARRPGALGISQAENASWIIVIRSNRKPGYADAVPQKYPPVLAVETEAGTVIGPAGWPLGDGHDLDIQVLDPIGPRFFDDCPICGAPATH